ncbi:MAG: hypothetical protein KAT09_07845 [Candidatus Aegiribacteria sp.]|nr:hypothetical protein [Candidatus Aegiribacteria sp.]
MKMITGVSISIFLSVMSFACGKNPAPETETLETETAVEQPDTLAQWVSWAEESGEGFWEDGSHRFQLSEAEVYGGQEMPPFYNVEGFSFRGDTMYISDPADQALVAVSLTTGERLWKVGEPGEGPGHFNGIGEVAAGSSRIAVCDMSNNRISLLSHSGEFITDISIQCPFDVTWKGDTLFALSLAEEKPLNMYDISGEFIAACGELPEEIKYLSYANRHLHGVMARDGSVLVISRFLSGIWKIDPVTGSTELFSETVFPQGEMVNDLQSGGFMVLCRDIFIGPDGMVNVILPMFTEEGGRLSDGGEPQMTTVIHRYSKDGEYLDSWALNGTVGIALMHGGQLFTVDRYADGVVIAHNITR